MTALRWSIFTVVLIAMVCTDVSFTVALWQSNLTRETATYIVAMLLLFTGYALVSWWYILRQWFVRQRQGA